MEMMARVTYQAPLSAVVHLAYPTSRYLVMLRPLDIYEEVYRLVIMGLLPLLGNEGLIQSRSVKKGGDLSGARYEVVSGPLKVVH
jgi:hypothetical protein